VPGCRSVRPTFSQRPSPSRRTPMSRPRLPLAAVVPRTSARVTSCRGKARARVPPTTLNASALSSSRRPLRSIRSPCAPRGWSSERMIAAIEHGSIATKKHASGPFVTRAELLWQAAKQWPFSVIEEALGPDADSRLRAGLRMLSLPVPVHRCAADALSYIAAQGDSPSRRY
jgi:hypothetical protein